MMLCLLELGEFPKLNQWVTIPTYLDVVTDDMIDSHGDTRTLYIDDGWQ